MEVSAPDIECGGIESGDVEGAAGGIADRVCQIAMAISNSTTATSEVENNQKRFNKNIGLLPYFCCSIFLLFYIFVVLRFGEDFTVIL